MRRPPAPLVIAHRGASGHRPENTARAYELAIELAADMIEIDVHRSRDGALVVTHDDSLEGLGGRGSIADATLAEIRALDAGGGERVPTLDEVLDAFGKRIPFNVEVKEGPRGPYPGLEEAVLAAVTRHGLLGETLFSSFCDAVLRRLRELAPPARIALLISPRTNERALERARALGVEAVNPWFGLAKAVLVDAVHAAGLAVYPYTVDEPEAMRGLLALGVDGIFTNFPERLRELLDAPGG